MPKPRTRRRSRKRRGGNPLTKNMGGLKHHLKHLDKNGPLIHTLKRAASKRAPVTPQQLMKAKTQLRSIQKHAGQAATAAGKGATKLNKLKSATVGGKRSRRKRSRRRRSRKRSRKRSRRRRSRKRSRSRRRRRR